MTHYLNSKGALVPIAGMITEHLQNALRKLQRTEPHRAEEIAAMHAELTRRQESAQ